MRKAPEAFRTISEAAEALDTPAHVLRFWESKFTQVKPVKRAGGRRYYRPADIDLLSGIKLLLHDQGMTIRGVQKLLQEKGARHVAAMAPLTGGYVEAEVIALHRSGADSTLPTTKADAPTDTIAVSSRVAETAQAPDPQAMASDPAQAASPDDQTDAAGDVGAEAVGDVGKVDATTVEEEEPAGDGTKPTQQTPSTKAERAARDGAPVTEEPTAPETPDTAEADDEPVPALAPLLEAATAGYATAPVRFAKIAHALRTTPPQNAQSFATALARLEALVEKLTTRID